MDEQKWLAERFEEQRAHLRAVAYRMLGSFAEADDAVQEAWLRLSRSDSSSIENLGGWLTTVVGRVCLGMLRSRGSRREDHIDGRLPDPVVTFGDGIEGGEGGDPEQQALLADSVGLALLVVLETLAPAERLAFVLHDMFGVPFDEIAPVVQRSSEATRQLASRARRRVRGTATIPDADLPRQREVVDAFFAAARGGDFDALVALLDPEVVLRSDAGGPGPLTVVRGAEAVARGAQVGADPSRLVQAAVVNGAAGVVITVDGQPISVMAFSVVGGKIVAIDALTDPDRLAQLDLAV
jgi:RNA polymerase sigma-70 factor (ECF subfamily)